MPTPRGSSGPRRGTGKKSSPSGSRPATGRKRDSAPGRPSGPRRRDDRDERPSRGRDERPSRGRDERPSRGRDDRRSRDDRAPRGRDERPSRGRDERPSRGRDDRRSRDDRAPRSRDERPSRSRDDRRSRDERPSRSRDDRRSRDERAPRSRDDRAPRGRDDRRSRDDRPSRGRDERVAPRQTDAQRRADEVKRRTGGRKYEAGAMPPIERHVERWVDEGSTRPRRQAAKQSAPARGMDVGDDRKASVAAQATVDSRALGTLVATLGEREGRKASTKVALALDAFERERWSDVKKLLLPLSRSVTGVEFVHELLGLSLYRLGQWIDAADHLEQARRLQPANAVNHPVLADCYRALQRYEKVDELWRELREASPDAAIVAEGRIVAASSQADRGDLAGAVRTMEQGRKDPAVPREHHLREWYVLADLYDRSGEVAKARSMFRKIERVDAAFADVVQRLEELGA